MNETKPGSTRASVAFFHVSAILGGAERSFLDLFPLPVDVTSVNLPEEGPLAAEIRRTSWGEALRFAPFASPLLRLSRGDGVRNLWALPRALPAIARYVRECRARIERERPAVVYSHGIKNHFLVTIAARGTEAAVVWHLQDFWPRNFLARIFLRWALGRGVHVICNSEAVRADLDPRARYADQVVVVHNSVDAAAYPARPRSGKAKDGKWILGFVGMLVPWKGPHVVLEAARLLAGRAGAVGGEVEVWIAGDVPYRTNSASSRYARDLRALAPPNVKFLGLVADPREIYPEIDVLLHTSVAPEPFGRVVLEGMSSGCVVVAADAGGPRELIEPGATGFLHAPGDARSLADAVVRALRLSPESSAELRARARAEVERRFSASAYRAAVAARIQRAATAAREKAR